MTFCAFFRLKSPSSSNSFIGLRTWEKPLSGSSSFESFWKADFRAQKKQPGYPGCLSFYSNS
ncbi:hypothetical protein HMPREF9413_3786 [Paenibacillus sp. HGF7]|nr:hypothetical protein HMPREF9413_3786 [Paenibacillus sp. HGF7]